MCLTLRWWVSQTSLMCLRICVCVCVSIGVCLCVYIRVNVEKQTQLSSCYGLSRSLGVNVQWRMTCQHLSNSDSILWSHTHCWKCVSVYKLINWTTATVNGNHTLTTNLRECSSLNMVEKSQHTHSTGEPHNPLLIHLSKETKNQTQKLKAKLTNQLPCQLIQIGVERN